VLAGAVERARRGEGPTFVEATTYRILGHTFGADQSYQPADELDAARAAEPVAAYRAWLVEEGHATFDALNAIDVEVADEIEDAIRFGKESPPPDLDELLVDVFADRSEVPV
jgi:TPP-dependent pyruvate/acetoin dehydrogenase alpha subunit